MLVLASRLLCSEDSNYAFQKEGLPGDVHSDGNTPDHRSLSRVQGRDRPADDCAALHRSVRFHDRRGLCR